MVSLPLQLSLNADSFEVEAVIECEDNLKCMSVLDNGTFKLICDPAKTNDNYYVYG